MPTDPWVWHRHRAMGRVHAYPRSGYDGGVSLCAKVLLAESPHPTEHDPKTDRCGLCVRRAQEVAR